MDESAKTAQETAEVPVPGQTVAAGSGGTAPEGAAGSSKTEPAAGNGGAVPETAGAGEKAPGAAAGGTDPSGEAASGNRETGAAGPPAGQHTDPAGKAPGGEEKGTGSEGKKPPEDPAAREEELRKREADLAKRELELEAKGILKKQGISETMLPYLLRENREETEKCVQAYKAAADAELKARLDERLTGKTPPQSAGHVTGGDRTAQDVFASALRG